MQPGEPYYEIIRSWIADGAKLDLTTPRVTKIEVFPVNPVVQRIGAKQQLRVLATYASGEVRDVTREAFLESANSEVAVAGRAGLITAVRRGEAPVLARFEGNYASTTLTVMGDRTGFVWTEPPAYGKIDELVAAKWQRMKILPSGLCTDAEFLRRVSPRPDRPAPDGRRRPQVPGRHARQPGQARRAGRSPDRQPRVRRLLDQQVGRPACRSTASSWASRGRWPSATGSAPRSPPTRPTTSSSATILTATGSNRENPAAAYFKILRDPAATMENTTQLFLAVRFNCNKCHDHPFERWTQDQYYQTAAYFAQVGLKADPAEQGPDDRRHRRRGAQAALRGRLRHRQGRGDPRPDQEGDRAQVPVFARLFQAGRRGTAACRAVGVADLEGQPLLRQELRQPALGLPARRRDHRAARRHPRRQPGRATPSCSTT